MRPMKHSIVAAFAVAICVAFGNAVGAEEWTKQKCEATAPGPATLNTGDIPHFCYGTFEDDPDIVAACARFDIDFNRPCSPIHSPLHVAAGLLSERAVAALLERGADPKLRMGSHTVLHGVANGCTVRPARAESCRRLLRLMVAKGLNLNDEDATGTSAFWYGIGAETRTVELMLDLGADIDQRGHLGKRALDYADEMHRDDLVSVLQRRGAQRGGWVYALRKRIDHYANWQFGS